jgi:8-oxo-dGTP pyrophosphatase MutT (NUDIX family)
MLKKLRIRIYKIIYPIWIIYLQIIDRPFQTGVCIIECNEKILLVRNTYGSMNWVFPGGRSKKGETQEESVIREVKEEVGISLDKIYHVGSYYGSETFKKHTVNFFYARVNSGHFSIDEKEIYEGGWFAWDDLPEPLSPDTVKIIQLYQAQRA